MFDTNPITVVIMERRKALAILLMVVVIAVPLSLGLIYIHDNPGDVTPIYSINSGITNIGANVTVKGNITGITVYMDPYGLDVWISDGTGILEFFWTQTRLDVGWTVIVKGTVSNNYTLLPTSSVELVLLFH